jgi:uncharacterized protein YjlB
MDMESTSTVNLVQQINILRYLLPDDGVFPNSPILPLLVYRKAFNIQHAKDEKNVISILENNSWVNSWKGSVYNYHHYHSTAHEVLAIVQGNARIQFGGPSGVSVFLEKGDMVIIPAGVAHKNLGDEQEFVCIGAYPDGQNYDMNYGKEGERPGTDENIRQVPLPETDPAYGAEGPLVKNWIAEPDKISELL